MTPDRKQEELNRRNALKGVVLGVGAIGLGLELSGRVEAAAVPWEKGKYQTFPRLYDSEYRSIFQLIVLGTLGPDVDTIFGIDFLGDIPTGALEIHRPSGEIAATRVVGIKRTDVETTEFSLALGGDRFDIFRVSEHGGDAVLDAMARLHALNTARYDHKVVYIGDLGLFQRQWPNEGEFLRTIIRAQRPGRPDLGIPEANFVFPRAF